MKRDQLKENALTHTEAMDMLYSEEIKKSFV